MNDKILQLNSSSLAENKDFLAWLKYDTNAKEWDTWLTSNPDQISKINEAKDKFYGDQDLVLGALGNTLKFTPTTMKIDKQKLWNRIESSTAGSVVELEAGTKNVRRLYGLSFAAGSS